MITTTNLMLAAFAFNFDSLGALSTELGALGLFFAAFFAATLLPLSSEGALLGSLALGMDPLIALGAASLGNSLGALSDYGMGRLFAEKTKHTLSQNKSGRQVLKWAEKYGFLSLFLSPLPIVGDPALFAAGIFRTPFPWVVTIGIGLRIARYFPIVWPFL